MEFFVRQEYFTVEKYKYILGKVIYCYYELRQKFFFFTLCRPLASGQGTARENKKKNRATSEQKRVFPRVNNKPDRQINKQAGKKKKINAVRRKITHTEEWKNNKNETKWEKKEPSYR